MKQDAELLEDEVEGLKHRLELVKSVLILFPYICACPDGFGVFEYNRSATRAMKHSLKQLDAEIKSSDEDVEVVQCRLGDLSFEVLTRPSH